jgi:hypothetical protein
VNEVNHRIVFFQISRLAADPDKSRHTRVQHVAFEYRTLDDLLGTYVRLKGLGIMPVFAFDEGFQAAVAALRCFSTWRSRAPSVAFGKLKAMAHAKRILGG